MFLFDASTKFKLQILAPAFVSFMIVLVAIAASAWTHRRAWVLVLSGVIIALSAYGQAGTVNELMKGGQGYASFRWYDSKAMEYLRLLPADIAIYTDEPGAVYLYTDRPAYVLPDRVDPVTAAQRPGFDTGRGELQLEVKSGRAVLALFSGGDLPAADGANPQRWPVPRPQVRRRGRYVPAYSREGRNEHPGEIRPARSHSRYHRRRWPSWEPIL